VPYNTPLFLFFPTVKSVSFSKKIGFKTIKEIDYTDWLDADNPDLIMSSGICISQE